jgi:hypothetical protein
VTTHFFDYLANNINTAFEKRCFELYYKDVKITPSKKTSLKKNDEKPKLQSAKLYQPEDSWVWDYKNSGQTLSASPS